MSIFLKTQLELKYYTTIHIGGVVEWAFFPQGKEDLPEVFSIIKNKLKVEFFILGRGSNVVIQDTPMHMAAIMTHRLNRYEIQEDLLIADAGIPMSFLSDISLHAGLAGLEFTYGLPGSIGGGVLMNARVFGSEFKDIVEWVEVYDYQKEEFLTISKTECDYRYKHSIFQEKPYFIVRAGLRLKKVDNIRPFYDIAHNNLKKRREKKQFAYPSAGSFFKNNYDLGKSSGEVLDSLGLKGFSQGGAKISEYHANFFVNPEGHATFQDIQDLMMNVEKILKSKYNIYLEPEVCFIQQKKT